MLGSELKEFQNKKFLFDNAEQSVRIEKGIAVFLALLDLTHSGTTKELLEKIIRAEKDANTLCLKITAFLSQFQDVSAKQSMERVEFARAILVRSLHIDLVQEIAKEEFDLEKVRKILVQSKEVLHLLLLELGKVRENTLPSKIPKGMVRLYHAVLSDDSFDLVRNFWRFGARSDLSPGAGQGEGFFVWTKFEYALKHFEFLSSLNSSKKNQVIIVIDTSLDVREWDLDAESHFNLIAPFIFDRFDLFQKIPDNVIMIEDKPLLVSKCSKSPFGKAIVFRFSRSSSCLAVYQEKASVHDAMFTGKIFTAMQRFFPHETAAIEREWMTNRFSEITGLKYVGNHPFSVASILILKDGNWIPADQVISDLGKKY